MCSEKDIDLKSLFGYISKNKYRLYDGLTAGCTGECLPNFDDHHKSEAEEWIKSAGDWGGCLVRMG